MKKVQTPINTVRLNESKDRDRQVVIHPVDDDAFVRTGKQVIEACRLGISVDLWLQELGSMFEEIRAWTDKRRERIESCYCSPRGSCVIFYFAPSLSQFDFELADELADLNVKLLHTFNVGMVEIHQVPFGELDRFLNEDTAKCVYGKQTEAPPSVEA